jgi:hydantoinase/carbamoylase family amidase
MSFEPYRALADLDELQELTSNARGAQRVAWTPEWRRARQWLAEKLAGLPVTAETDEAGNLWASLRGESPRAVLVGSHLDSVPDGGNLDGALGVVAGLELLRMLVARGAPPTQTVRLVDFADEEGTRFGRSLFGSSCVSGTIDVAHLETLRDAEGRALPKVLSAHGVQLARVLDARHQLENATAYVELHVEQGPVLERLGLPLGVASGTYHIERHSAVFLGRTAHESWPLDLRRDALAGASRLALEVREIARRVGGYATVGSVVPNPGFVTAVAGECNVAVDLRHREDSVALRMFEEAQAAASEIASSESLSVTWSPLWRMPAVDFDAELIALAHQTVEEVAGTSYELPSGPLHDAAEIARAGVPSVLLFVQSIDGVSHAKEERTDPEHLKLAISALVQLAAQVVDAPLAGPLSSAPRR